VAADAPSDLRQILIGFGEPAVAFVEGWTDARPRELHPYDRKLDGKD
jgi:hypothetical protein